MKGALAGLVGGLLATAVKSSIEKVHSQLPGVESESSAPLESLQGRERSERQSGTHWGFGAAVGAAYGAFAELYPPVTSKLGASFGMAMVPLAHDTTIPLLGAALAAAGISARPEPQTTREHFGEMASNIAFGVVTETTRRIVRRAID